VEGSLLGGSLPSEIPPFHLGLRGPGPRASAFRLGSRPEGVQQAEGFRLRLGGEVTIQALMFLRHQGIQPGEKGPTRRGQSGPNLSPVQGTPLSLHPTPSLHPVQKPAHIGHSGEESIPDLPPAESRFPRTPQDAEHVVLLGREPVGFEKGIEGIQQTPGRAHGGHEEGFEVVGNHPLI
jgi:hypothetical protein